MKFGIVEVKADLKAKTVWLCTTYPSLTFLLYQVSNQKSVKPGSSKNLQASHTYPSVELIPTGRIVESIMIVDAFNDDPSFYVVPNYGC